MGLCTCPLLELHLQRNGLSGRLPAALGQCVALHSLRLSHNFLTGPIPSELGQCPALANVQVRLDFKSNSAKDDGMWA
jgi:hypothetical protein